MKKVLALMLALVLVLSLGACGSGSDSGEKKDDASAKESNSNEIELTLDNYSKYLSISGGIGCNENDERTFGVEEMNNGSGIKTDSSYAFILYNSIYYSVTVAGISQNFNYNDIKVTAKLTGSCKTYKYKPNSEAFNGSQKFEKNIEVECDITGHGDFFEQERLPDRTYTHSEVMESNFEIVSISGTVTPA